ncbi:MAG TPA: 50S ribosomal protein L25 [Candidatus Saccharimonadales bacterium]|nr:50S ribosomal protein L25 [Candidatus Saccharimonadales bacterium]
MNEVSLKLDARTEEGKKVAKLRASGFVPSVVYGGHAVPLSTKSPVVETTKIAKIAGKHTPVNLVIDGKKKLAIIKDIDMDPVKHVLRHVAFHTIRQNDVITTEVPVILTGQGESEAEKAGLVVLQAIEMLEVKAKPAALPESIELSIAGLASTEDRITVADVTLPEGVEFADVEQDMDLVIANVYEPGALQAANEAAGGDAEDESEVESENGEDTQAEEDQSGDKGQGESKQSNADANK